MEEYLEHAKYYERKIMKMTFPIEFYINSNIEFTEQRYKLDDVIDSKGNNDLICSVCDTFFNVPFILDCGHTFCEYCIEKKCSLCQITSKNMAYNESIYNRINELKIKKCNSCFKSHKIKFKCSVYCNICDKHFIIKTADQLVKHITLECDSFLHRQDVLCECNKKVKLKYYLEHKLYCTKHKKFSTNFNKILMSVSQPIDNKEKNIIDPNFKLNNKVNLLSDFIKLMSIDPTKGWPLMEYKRSSFDNLKILKDEIDSEIEELSLLEIFNTYIRQYNYINLMSYDYNEDFLYKMCTTKK